MLTCQSCGDLVAPGQLDCPYCGSLLNKVQSISSEPLYTIVPKYIRGLSFRQNLPAILFFSLVIGLPYMIPVMIPLAINPNLLSPAALEIVLVLSYIVAYCLGILTMLAYFKSASKAIKLVIYDNKMEYYSRATKGMSKSVMGILTIDNISMKQSQAQKKYNLGTLILNLKFRMGESKEFYSLTRKIHNVERAEFYCEKIKGLRDTAKALVAQ
jgi:hypothetical protein